MKILITYLSISLLSYPIQSKQVTIYIIGDSTAANKLSRAFPETGWGMELNSFFDQKIKIDNRALNGRSTKSFLNEKRWESVLSSLKAGDYVLIEFGHNDEKVDKPEIGTSLGEYRDNLIKFVSETLAKKARPILMTPIMRRSFKDGVLIDTHLGYPEVVRKLADSLQVPLVDMHRKTEKLLVGLGEQQSIKLFNHVDSGHVNYPMGKKDNTHLSPEGAKIVALVVEGIRENRLGLAKHILPYHK
jgi:lysophospholipase L1-like esterase